MKSQKLSNMRSQLRPRVLNKVVPQVVPIENYFVQYKFPNETLEEFKARWMNISFMLNDVIFYLPDKNQTIINTLKWQRGIYDLYEQYGQINETYAQFLNWSQQRVANMVGSVNDRLEQLGAILARNG